MSGIGAPPTPGPPGTSGNPTGGHANAPEAQITPPLNPTLTDTEGARAGNNAKVAWQDCSLTQRALECHAEMASAPGAGGAGGASQKAGPRVSLAAAESKAEWAVVLPEPSQGLWARCGREEDFLPS